MSKYCIRKAFPFRFLLKIEIPQFVDIWQTFQHRSAWNLAKQIVRGLVFNQTWGGGRKFKLGASVYFLLLVTVVRIWI
jgi:hypothetical protein